MDESLIRALLAEQHPDLAHLPVMFVGEGWDNVVARLGDELVVRLPRRSVVAASVEQEIRWLPELAPRLPLPIPVPVRIGRPGAPFWRGRPMTPSSPASRRTLDAVLGEASARKPGRRHPG